MAKINHLDFLNLIYKNKDIINEGYKRGKIDFSPSSELLDINLFQKINEYYYINPEYVKLIDTILNRADIGYIVEDFDKEFQLLNDYKKDYKFKKTSNLLKAINNLLIKIYQGMWNRDNNILSLIENFERDNDDLDFLIKEATRILLNVEEVNKKNGTIYNLFQEFIDFPEFRDFINEALSGITILSKKSYFHLDRLRNFISQTERKRKFNQKLFKVENMILNENIEIDDYLLTKLYPDNLKIKLIADSEKIKVDKLNKIVGNLKRKKEIKEIYIKEISPSKPIYLINIKDIVKNLTGADDIFLSVLNSMPKINKDFMNESMRIFCYILNHYNKNIEYTSNFNKYDVRIIKWKKKEK